MGMLGWRLQKNSVIKGSIEQEKYRLCIKKNNFLIAGSTGQGNNFLRVRAETLLFQSFKQNWTKPWRIYCKEESYAIPWEWITWPDKVFSSWLQRFSSDWELVLGMICLGTRYDVSLRSVLWLIQRTKQRGGRKQKSSGTVKNRAHGKILTQKSNCQLLPSWKSRTELLLVLGGVRNGHKSGVPESLLFKWLSPHRAGEEHLLSFQPLFWSRGNFRHELRYCSVCTRWTGDCWHPWFLGRW